MTDVPSNGHETGRPQGRNPEPGETLTYVTRPRSITAASRRIEGNNRDDLSHVPKKPERWQEEGWAYFDAVPEIKFAARFNGNALSRLRIFPAVVLDQDSAPVPIQDAIGELGITQQLADAAVDETSRLGDTETVAGFFHEWGVNLTVPGDSYFVATPETPTEAETWMVYSESAITTTSQGLALREKPGKKPELFPPGTLAIRVWRRHSRWPGLADSNLRSILAECEELLIYSRQFRAIGRSRNNAGLLFLSNKLDVPPNPNAKPGELTTLESGLMQSMITPTHDDSSAASVMPHVVRGDGKPDDLIKHFPLDRKIDEQAIARVTFLISRCAHGLDSPVEVLTGVADVNHWNAWQIEDQSYKMHLQPLAMVPASGLAKDFLRPALIIRGFDPEVVGRVLYALDSSHLTVRPNRAGDAVQAFDRGAITWEALRQHLGFGENEAPDDAELEQRARFGLLKADTGTGLFGDRGSGSTTSAAFRSIGQALGLVPELPPVREAITASSRDTTRRVVADLGERLANIELRLRDRIQVRASEAMNAALRVAGNRLKTRAQGNPVMRALVRGSDGLAVFTALGEEAAITAAGGTTAGLLDGQFDDVGDDFDAWVEQTQTQVARIIRSVAPDDTTADLAIERYERNQTDNRRTARDALLAALLLLGTRRMFTPDGTPDLGEFDSRLAVPAGLVREALALAGGSSGPGRPPTGVPSPVDAGLAGGVALGPDALSALDLTGISGDGYIWSAGFPDRPFEPHQDLDGVAFADWDDPVLAYDGWPADENGGQLWVGDHDGCQCIAVPIFTESTGEG